MMKLSEAQGTVLGMTLLLQLALISAEYRRRKKGGGSLCESVQGKYGGENIIGGFIRLAFMLYKNGTLRMRI